MTTVPRLLALLLLVTSRTALATDCPATDTAIDLQPVINSWGGNPENHRFVSGTRAGLNEANVAQLQPRWVFALPETDAPRSQPAVTADTVFIADGDGGVHALSRSTGCTRWRFEAGAMVRTALRLVQAGDATLLTFGTLDADLVAVDPRSGTEVWRTRVSEHPRAMISGSTAAHDGVLYQGVSSWEVFWALNPFYACCTFRGAIVAMDAATGDILWRSHTIEQEPTVFESRWLLPDHRGPSGAPVWSQPTLDIKRQRLYVGTGENYSSPATDTSDAILAFDLESGKLLWKQQFTRGDAWNVACVAPGHHNCPAERGGDLDFGAPPILVTADGRDYLLAGQKSGRVFALDPEDGALLWTQAPGGGGKAGGVHFGMAVDPGRGLLYVPISDRDVGRTLGDSSLGAPRPSLHAIDIASGAYRWSIESPADCLDGDGDAIDGCYRGFSAPVTVAGDLVFAPTLDGVLRAFHADSGKQLWQFNTMRSFTAVNGGRAKGGTIDLGGAYIAEGELYLSSGYELVNQIGGNAFIAFGPPSPPE